MSFKNKRFTQKIPIFAARFQLWNQKFVYFRELPQKVWLKT